MASEKKSEHAEAEAQAEAVSGMSESMNSDTNTSVSSDLKEDANEGEDRRRQHEHVHVHVHAHVQRASEPEVLAVGLGESITAVAMTDGSMRSSVSVGSTCNSITSTAEVRMLAKELNEKDRQVKKQRRSVRATLQKGTGTLSQSQSTSTTGTCTGSSQGGRVGLARKLPPKFGSNTARSASAHTNNASEQDHQSLPGAYSGTNQAIDTNDTNLEETKQEEEPDHTVSQHELPLIIEASLVTQNSQSLIVDGGVPGQADHQYQDHPPQVQAIEADKVQLAELLQNPKLQCFLLGLILCFVVIILSIVIIVVVVSQTRNPNSDNNSGTGDTQDTLAPVMIDDAPSSLSINHTTAGAVKGDYKIVFPPDMQQYISETYDEGIPDNNSPLHMDGLRKQAFCNLMESQTEYLTPKDDITLQPQPQVVTSCTLHNELAAGSLDSRLDFTMRYSSNTVNVSEYPFLFYQHISSSKLQPITDWVLNINGSATNINININNDNDIADVVTSAANVGDIISFAFLRYYDTEGTVFELGDAYYIQAKENNDTGNLPATWDWVDHNVIYQQVLLFVEWPAWNSTLREQLEQRLVDQANLAAEAFWQEMGKPMPTPPHHIDSEILNTHDPRTPVAPFVGNNNGQRRLRQQHRNLASDRWEMALVFEMTWSVPTFEGGKEEDTTTDLLIDHFHTYMVDHHKEFDQALEKPWGPAFHSASPPMELFPVTGLQDNAVVLGAYRQRFLVAGDHETTFEPYDQWEEVLEEFAMGFLRENASNLFVEDNPVVELGVNVTLLLHTNHGIPGRSNRVRRKLRRSLQQLAEDARDLQQQEPPEAVAFVHYIAEWYRQPDALAIKEDQLGVLPKLFQSFLNENLPSLTNALRNAGFDVTSSRPAYLVPSLSLDGLFIEDSILPTTTPPPQASQLTAHSTSHVPSTTPSFRSSAPSSLSATDTPSFPPTGVPSGLHSVEPSSAEGPAVEGNHTTGPSDAPPAYVSSAPTPHPTFSPTVSSQPSYSNGYTVVQVFYSQQLHVEWENTANPQFLGAYELDIMERVFEKYTMDIAGRDANVVKTTWRIANERIEFLDHDTPYLDLQYEMLWESCHTNVTHLPGLFLDFQAANQDRMSGDLQTGGFQASWFGQVKMIAEPAYSFVYTACY
ncbi:expressed unknown protein [Seminavis robusta]|uniref:Uncharacterized protein n=1 Tax=Seminavis robusta TaxID=568900 RepID=A0A9N8EI67_9STRA|nr:expressed unknown protein [Seminavis robusta]|eukprot:Sro993_g228920.1 n/a (1143) ;mRNA; r:15493-18921